MPLREVAAFFFGGMFLSNFTPHFIAGVSGQRFYTPFAKPPFRGLSSPLVNVLYGLFNLSIAYVLLIMVGSFELRRATHVVVLVAGFGLWSVNIARSVTKMRGGSA
jgi:hypothetical protein